jgi:hypothetical protein
VNAKGGLPAGCERTVAAAAGLAAAQAPREIVDGARPSRLFRIEEVITDERD